MRNTLPYRSLTAVLLVLGLQQGSIAQVMDPLPYTVRVAGLTSAERDAVVRDLAEVGDARLVFACVPAGLLVFEPTPNRDRNAARSSATSILISRAQRERITEVTLSLADAETACAEARNR